MDQIQLSLIIVSIVFVSLSLAILPLRLWSRKITRKLSVFPEDVVVLCGWVSYLFSGNLELESSSDQT